MTANDVCPAPEILVKLIAGELSSQLEARWIRHIDGCPRCQRELERASSTIFDGPLHQLTEASLDTTVLADVVGDAKAILRRDHDKSWSDAWIGEVSRSIQSVGFKFVRVLGRGGMGVVFLAFEASLNRYVAIKVLAPDMAEQADARERFLREARAAAAVKHPNIITIHAVSDLPPLPYLTMEYVEGKTLQQLIDHDRRLSLKQVIDYSTQIAKALSKAHAEGIVHRDIKPANILIENGSGLVKVTDFGLAQSTGQTHLTRTGVIVGTPAFLAPEALDDQVPFDCRGDLFSLGSVMYAMCCGVSPFESDSILKTLRKIESKPPPSIRDRFPDFPLWLENLVFKLLQKHPLERFQSASEVLEALRLGESAPAMNIAPVIKAAESTGNLKRRKKKESLPLAWTLVAAFATLSLIVSGFALARFRGDVETVENVSASPPTDELVERRNRNRLGQTDPDPRVQRSRLLSPQMESWFFIVQDGTDVAEYSSLEEAIEESGNQGVIEIRTDETIEVAQLFAERSSLTIAAGADFRPTIQFVGDPETQDDEPCFLVEGDLTLEGVRLLSDEARGEESAMLRVDDGNFSATDCEFRCSGHCLQLTNCDSVLLVNCDVHSGDGATVVLMNEEETQIQLVESTFSGNVAVWMELGPSTRFEMSQCVLVAPEVFNLWVSDDAVADDWELEGLATLEINRSLLVAEMGIFCLDEPDSEEEVFEEFIRWNGSGNLLSGPVRHLESHGWATQEELEEWMRQFGGSNPQRLTNPFEAGDQLWSLRSQPDFRLRELTLNPDLSDEAFEAINRAELPFES